MRFINISEERRPIPRQFRMGDMIKFIVLKPLSQSLEVTGSVAFHTMFTHSNGIYSWEKLESKYKLAYTSFKQGKCNFRKAS